MIVRHTWLFEGLHSRQANSGEPVARGPGRRECVGRGGTRPDECRDSGDRSFDREIKRVHRLLLPDIAATTVSSVGGYHEQETTMLILTRRGA
jgi:hypothetical protein